MTKTEELKNVQEIAWAKYKVAGDLGWIIAILTGIVCNLKWQTGWWSMIIAIVVYFAVIHFYSRKADAATDNYHREAKIGKYSNIKLE